MNAKQKLHQVHLNEWAERFADQKASGLTVAQWCAKNNFSVHSYNYWKHLLKEQLVDQMLPDIVPVSFDSVPTLSQNDANQVPSNCSNRAICTIRANSVPVKLSLNGVSIELDSSVPEDFLITLIKAVRHA